MPRLKSIAAATALAAAIAFIAFAGWRFAATPFQDVQLPRTLSAAEAKRVQRVIERVRARADAGLKELVAALEALDWVRAARARRLWPGAVRIDLDLRAAPPPSVAASAAGATTQRIYEALNPAIADAGLTLAALQRTELGGWRVVLSNGVPILLGDAALSNRLARALAVYDDQLAERVERVDRIDARYASGVAVRWRPVAAVAQTVALASK